MRAVIFVTDDEQAIRWSIIKRLTRQGHHVVGYESGEALLEGLQHRLLDLKMPGLSGLETLKHVRQLAPAAIVILLTAYGTLQDVVETMKLWAYDFMIKSVDLEGIDAVIARALDVLRLRRRLESELSQQDSRYHMKNLEAHSPAMQQLLEQVREVAESPKSSVKPEQGKSSWHTLFTTTGRGCQGRLSESIAPRFPKNCSRVNCSASSEALLPVPRNGSSACWKKRRAALSFSMRSAIWIRRCRPNCCV